MSYWLPIWTTLSILLIFNSEFQQFLDCTSTWTLLFFFFSFSLINVGISSPRSERGAFFQSCFNNIIDKSKIQYEK